nr:C40 family peptidase [Kibdelosporangium sp. MJ126-NF4]CEL22673.1 similar to Cell wall-associated hydrolase (invasion-associated proteins) [Kibdelosporangium sp. MJ126-NF4]CTQ89814.1 similar to Cell wall-associated hydrolase (invasion-associated proteins) [Kibdelosporangium sp. MJ126-NF4]
MASQRLKRTMRGALTASAIITMVSATAAPAIAQPPAQNNESEALQKFRELSAKSELVNEEYNKATDDKAAKQAELDKATSDLAAANQAKTTAAATENQYRGQVESLSFASLRGARFNKLSALLTGTSTQDFLDRSSALGVLAADNAKALSELHNAVTTATEAEARTADAQNRATEARNAASKLQAEINTRRQELHKQIKVAEAEYKKLSQAEKDKLRSGGASADNGQYLGPPGAANTAMQAALSRRGDPYKWSGMSPGAFDCSGLMMWSYGQAGIRLPRSSRAQYTVGRAVSRDALQHGDLLFFGGSAGSIHHVAMYVGDGKMVHAPNTGDVVKVVPLGGGGSDYFGAKRVVG